MPSDSRDRHTNPPKSEKDAVPCLVIQEGPLPDEKKKVLALSEMPITLGRGRAAQVYLKEDQSISREHAVIDQVGSAVVIYTVSEQHDTLVNGKKASKDKNNPTPLKDGDQIQIQSYTLLFQEQSKPQATPDACLAVYFLLDASGSMAGAPVEALQGQVTQFIKKLSADALCREKVRLALVCFGDEAKELLPLTNVAKCIPPVLSADGFCALGQALKYVEPAIAEKRGPRADPLIFVLIDGVATDAWEDVARRIEKYEKIVISCALGSRADTEMLKIFSQKVVTIASHEDTAFGLLFEWLADYVKALAHAQDGSGLPAAYRSKLPGLPSLPAGIQSL